MLARLAPRTLAVLDGDFGALRALCGGHSPAPDPGATPPAELARAWNLGCNARTPTVAACQHGQQPAPAEGSDKGEGEQQEQEEQEEDEQQDNWPAMPAFAMLANDALHGGSARDRVLALDSGLAGI